MLGPDLGAVPVATPAMGHRQLSRSVCLHVCTREASGAGSSSPFLGPTVFTSLLQPVLDTASLPGYSPGVSATHVGKSHEQEVRGAGPASCLGLEEAGRSPSRAPQPQPSSRPCLGGGPRPPPTHPGLSWAGGGWAGAGDTWGRGLAGTSCACWRQGQVAAGVADLSGDGGGRKKKRAVPHGIPERERLRRRQRASTGSAFGFRAGGESPSPAQLAGPGGWPRAGLRDRRRHRHIDLLAGWGWRRQGRPLPWRPRVGCATPGEGARRESWRGARCWLSGFGRGPRRPSTCALCIVQPWRPQREEDRASPRGGGGAGRGRRGGGAWPTRPRGSQRERGGRRAPERHPGGRGGGHGGDRGWTAPLPAQQTDSGRARPPRNVTSGGGPHLLALSLRSRLGLRPLAIGTRVT